MGVFATPEQGTAITRTFFEKIAGQPDIVAGLQSLACVVEFRHIDPKFSVCWDLRGEGLRVLVGAPEDKPALKVLFKPADVAHQIWTGEISAARAIMTRKIKVQGNVTKLLKITPLQKKVFPFYLDTLRELGHEEFIPEHAGAGAD